MASGIVLKSEFSVIAFDRSALAKGINRWGVVLLWLLLTSTVFFRTPIPVDETRYLSVAWEMWLHNDYLVPHLNGQAYSHKPPLLFWLFQLGWAVFGVNEWWPKLVGPLAALVNLELTRKLAQKFWPGESAVSMAPWVLISTLLWTLFATSAMFDVLLTCFVLLALLGWVEIINGYRWKGVLFVGCGMGFGLLAKGPVVFLHVLPVVLFARYWLTGQVARDWYVRGLSGVFVGVCIALAWAIPAALLGGDAYGDAIFWKQIADRTIATEIHVRPFFWYALFLPLVLFPWIMWPRFWMCLKKSSTANDMGLRFCSIWLISGFVIFSLLNSKQIHYLVPLMPAFALVVARVVTRTQVSASRWSEFLPPLVLMMFGLGLILLPQMPVLSAFQWAKNIHSGWGLSVIMIALLLLITVWRTQRLSLCAVSTSLVFAVFVGFICFFQYNGQAFDLRPAAQQLQILNSQGYSCVFVGNYQGQLNFLGRLTQPVQTIYADQLEDWVNQHPEGYLISVEKQKPDTALYVQAHREYWLVFRSVKQWQEIRPL